MPQLIPLVILGGGPAGLTAALAARKHTVPLLIEGSARVGKKILTAGNGRCNLSNARLDPTRYHTDDSDKLRRLLERFSPAHTLSLFSSLGLSCREEEEGRLYPYSGQASSVLDALRFALIASGVEIQCGDPAAAVRQTDGGFSITLASGRTILTRRLILACGGRASPVLSGDPFSLLRALPLRPTSLAPALCPLPSPSAHSLKGLRVRAQASLFLGDELLGRETGEIQFTEAGLSGIVIFQLSALYARHFSTGARLSLSLDLFPSHRADELRALLAGMPSYLSAEQLLCGLLPKHLGIYAVKQVFSGPLHSPKSDVDPTVLARTLKDLRFPVSGLSPWERAQVTSGGVPLSQVSDDLEASCPGLYLCGEMLNVDGPCGGYNLQWAWTSGTVAGQAAGRSLLKKD